VKKPCRKSREGFFFVITAPSGGWKDPLIHRLREEFPQIRFSVSTTTAAPLREKCLGAILFREPGNLAEMVQRGNSRVAQITATNTALPGIS
jgi:guanylate kinase